MATIIGELAALMHALPGYAVQTQAADMLVTLSLGNGRQQTVKVQTRQGEADPLPVIHLQSRAALVTRPDVVRDALRRNAGTRRAGFALDLSVRPPALDVVCGLAVGKTSLPVSDFFHALIEVATLADEIEQRLTGGGDRF